jgi:hypothetical protein
MEDAESEADLARKLNAFPRLEAWLGFHERFELTRFAILRLLGFVYTAAYLSLARQVVPLVGREGLMPARAHVARTIATFGSRVAAFAREPSLFYFVEPSDGLLLGLSLVGLALSIALLAGVSNALIMIALVVLYRSFIAMGQLFYGYGWELLLIETGFLAIFLCPLRGILPFPVRRVPLAIVWLFRWLALRVMLGAGLIKVRGDSCWRDLTCLDFHFETQPIPNPLSPYYHALPHSLLAGGVLFNHLCELVLPLCILGPRKLRIVAAVGMTLFQLMLITSGNLSFLNWLTIVPLLACFDDRALARVLPRRLHERGGTEPATRTQVVSAGALSAIIALLSIGPLSNMLARRQRMNAAFDSLMLVNSYGAFGSVGRVRPELVIEGTRDDDPGPESRWLSYELPFKPGDVERPHRIVSPCQPRLDWQIWFAAMAQAEDEPWMLHLVWKLLHADPGVRKLLAHDPFGDDPPKYVRVMRYRYRFAPLGSDAYWTRELEGYWLPPLPADEILHDAMIQLGYIEPTK